MLSPRQMNANLAVSIGGRVAEELIFGYDKVKTGASSDIQYATEMARDMVTRWGMSDELGRLHYAEPDERCSSAIRSTAHGRCRTRPRRRSTRKSAASSRRLRPRQAPADENRDELETLAEALLEYETLTGDEIKKLIAGERSTAAAPRARAPGRRLVDPEGQRPRPAPSAARPPRELTPRQLREGATIVQRPADKDYD